MGLKRIFVLIFVFALLYTLVSYAGYVRLEWSCAEMPGHSTASQPLTLEVIPALGNPGPCDGSAIVFYTGAIDHCTCEGTYSVSAESSCPDGDDLSAGPQVAYIVDYDDPLSITPSDLRLYISEPYYCRGDCIKWKDEADAYHDINVYWDSVEEECCGDDFIYDGAGGDPDVNPVGQVPAQPMDVDDPDNSEGFCTHCPLGNIFNEPGKRDWLDGQGCCGDDFDGYGTDNDLGQHGNYLCFYDPGSRATWTFKMDPVTGDTKYVPDKQVKWHWLIASGDVVEGAIVDVYEMDGEYDYIKNTLYSDGSWKTPTEGTIYSVTVTETHEYLAYRSVDDELVMAECCGSEKSDSDRTKCFSVVTLAQSGGGTITKPFGGERYEGGEAVTDDDGDTYYCTGDAEWRDMGDLFGSLGDSSACSGFAGCTWTGNHCCCDFLGTTYSDPESGGGTGKACWKGELLNNGATVDDDPNYVDKVINEDGQLYFCKPAGASDYGADDVGGLVESKVPCEAAATSHCDVSGNWESDSPTQLKTQLTYSPTDPNDEACCLDGQCWLGVSEGFCHDDQSTDPSQDPDDGANDKLCIEGDWISGVEKFTPYGVRGNCISQDQCLFGAEGSAELSCEGEGFYYRDFYCQDGEWATRTKLLAMKLMEIGQSRGAYTLTCSNAFEILNNFGYNVRGQNIQLGHFDCDQLTGECTNVNNFCVLEYGNNMLIGTSINRPVDDPAYSIMNVFDYDADCCNDFIRSAATDYVRCDGCNLDIWFNNQSGIFIYNRLGEELTRDDPPTQIFDFLLTPVTSLFDWIMARFGNDPMYDEPKYDLYVEFPERFDKLYVKDFGGRKTFAVMETQPDYKYFTIRYEGFDEDMCDLIKEYDDRVINPTEDWDYLVCEENSPGVYDVIGGSYYRVHCTLEDLDCLNINVWRDLTTKLK